MWFIIFFSGCHYLLVHEEFTECALFLFAPAPHRRTEVWKSMKTFLSKFN